MAYDTLLTDLSHGVVDGRQQLVYALHHPHNRRNGRPPRDKPHNSTGVLGDELFTDEGNRQIALLAAYLAHIATEGSLPPVHPLPPGTPNRALLSGRVAEVLFHTPGTARCYLAASAISERVRAEQGIADRAIAVGNGRILQGGDYGLRGPNMGAMNGLTTEEMRERFPPLYEARAKWEEAYRQSPDLYKESLHPFPPDFPGGSTIPGWIQRWEQALCDALRLHLMPQEDDSVTMRIFVLTTSGTHILSTLMNAKAHQNIDNEGYLGRLEAPDSRTGQLAGWLLTPGCPPRAISDGFIPIPEVTEPSST